MKGKADNGQGRKNGLFNPEPVYEENFLTRMPLIKKNSVTFGGNQDIRTFFKQLFEVLL